VGYEVYVEHPESFDRRREDFASWSMWAPQHAPWTGVGISEMAKLIKAVCEQENAPDACSVLDNGGILSPENVQVVWRLANHMMGAKVRQVFQRARADRYPVRVVFSKGFGSLSASAYLAKQSST
jgi:hypothetical protein